MNLRPLIIGADEIKKLNTLRDFALQNVFSYSELLLIKDGKAKCAGDRPGFLLHLDLDYHIVFSIEEHPLKDNSGFAKCMHLSMSVGDLPVKDVMPNPKAVEMIMQLLKFRGRPQDAAIWVELDYIIHVVEAMDPAYANYPIEPPSQNN